MTGFSAIYLRPFVPQTVQNIVEKNPDAPLLDKIETEITVLFLDVAGYTKISESLNQDQVNFIIEKYSQVSWTYSTNIPATSMKPLVTGLW